MPAAPVTPTSVTSTAAATPAAVPSVSATASSTSSSAADPAIGRWFLTAAQRRNPATALRAHTTGNLVEPLVHGRTYFARLRQAVDGLGAGDLLFLAAFRGDADAMLDGPDHEVADVLGRAARRGARVWGLLWRSQPGLADQSEAENAELARRLQDDGAEVVLDARTRRAGTHHQKLVVCRGQTDVAFVGGIDLARGRNDDAEHLGDERPQDFPEHYGPTPPWHDIQVAISGPAVTDVELTFRERWDGSPIDLPSPFRMAYDRVRHAGTGTTGELPTPRPDPAEAGPHAVQVLRTYPARWRRYPFAPLGERSIAAAYRLALSRARVLVYIEDQHLWAPGVAALLGKALRENPDLRLVVVVPRYPDKEGRSAVPSLLGRERAMTVFRAAGADRFAIYDVENHRGEPVYVHSKVVCIDDVWAMVGSDNMNRRSWTHDGELSCAVLDSTRDTREPVDPAGEGDGARTFSRELRLQLMREHLDRDDDTGLVDPAQAFAEMADSARTLQDWYDDGCQGPRPGGRLRPHQPERVRRRDRGWATVVERLLYDPDGRAFRDRVLHRP